MTMGRKLLTTILLMMTVLFIAACGGQEAAQQDAGNNGAANTTENEGANEQANEEEETMEPVTLKFADFFPPTHPFQAELIPAWAQAINEATNGLVTIETYPGGSLLGNGDIYPGVEQGLADIGHDVSGYNPGRLPVLNSMYLGGIEYKNSKVSSYVAWDLVHELQPAELQDTQLMFLYGMAPGVLMTTEPIRTLEDLKGKQIRASGTNVDTLEMLGATPVALPISETYEAMARGVVDGSLLPVEALKGFNLAEVTKYVTHSSLIYNTVHYVTMNKQVWESFPAHIQEAITKVNEEFFEKAVELFSGLMDEGLRYAVEEHGVQEIHLTEEEHARWEEALAPLIDRHIEELNKQGLDGQLIMDKIRELADKYNKEFGDE